MQETKVTRSFELHLGGTRIFAFQIVRITQEAPIGKMAEIIDAVARKMGVDVEDVNEG